ncbi:MAG: ribosome small subunit-dependent GTPase A [Bacilli bacterium]|nr:ribosome small subunit-dependent GTPase A [Bacilli bacterium]
MMQGQIIKQISNLYTVKVGDMLYGCRARGKFRKDNISPMVGDYVIINTEDNVIESILERKNELDRPVIANVDIALIVTSTKKPNLDLNLLDKLISVITFNDIEPVVCFTKLDLLNEVEKENIDNLRKYYEMIGINCVYNTETAEIKRLLDNNIVVLAGQTGAGKSSLLNRLDDELDIETNEISEALGRGKHTTRHVELYEISDGYIADTPGFSALDLKDMNKEQLRDTFVEFRNYECKFRDCMHHKESKCGVKEALEDKMILQSRYNNYLLFLEEVEK